MWNILADDEDVFEYDNSLATPETSILKEVSENPETPTEKPENFSELVDLSNEEAEVTEPTRLKRVAGSVNTINPDDSYDLTDDTFEITPPKKSRRAADSVPNDVIATYELDSEESVGSSELNNNESKHSDVAECENVSDNATIVTRTRRGRLPNRAKASAKAVKLPRMKKMNYKQALAIASAPIPAALPFSPEVLPTLPVVINHHRAGAATRSSAVDLTGDVLMTDKHSSAPLFQKQVVAPKQLDLDESDFDFEVDDRDVIKVKVRTKTEIKSYPHRRHQRYYDLFKTLADQESIPVSNIFLFDGDKRIHPEDTPHSTNFRITTILNFRVMEAKACEFKQTARKNQIELKFQSDKWKKPIVVKMSKIDNFKTATEILCEQVPFKPAQISLRFDGDPVNLSDTPMDLEFDGGEILDCGVKV